MIWCIAQASNTVPVFKQRIINDEVIEFDKVCPSYTFLKNGSDAFKVCTIDIVDDIITFDRIAKSLEENQDSLFGESSIPPESLIYLSCLPWIETTCISSERDIDINDCIPRISWGKYSKKSDGSIIQNISVDVNHRVIDGYHIGVFGEALQNIIGNL